MIMVNSLFNGWRMEDVWLEKSPAPRRRRRSRHVLPLLRTRHLYPLQCRQVIPERTPCSGTA